MSLFLPLDKMTLEPDILILTAKISQAEIVMRVMSYSTEEIRSSKLTGVGACTWLFTYPYLTGKVNYGHRDELWHESKTGIPRGIDADIHPF